MHCLQGYLTQSCNAILCSVRLTSYFCSCLINALSARFFTPWCTALWWWARLGFDLAWWLHCLQGYLTHSCTALWRPKKYDFDSSLLSWELLFCIFITMLNALHTGNNDSWICLSYQCWWWTNHIIMALDIMLPLSLSGNPKHTGPICL